jgi:6-phosphogluconate dehydrogenase
VIESRLVGWLLSAFLQYGEDLTGISGSVAQSGEGLWTVEAGKKLGIAMPIIEAALDFRMKSQEHPSYTGKVLSAMRHQFGGHEVKAKK